MPPRPRGRLVGVVRTVSVRRPPPAPARPGGAGPPATHYPTRPADLRPQALAELADPRPGGHHWRGSLAAPPPRPLEGTRPHGLDFRSVASDRRRFLPRAPRGGGTATATSRLSSGEAACVLFCPSSFPAII